MQHTPQTTTIIEKKRLLWIIIPSTIIGVLSYMTILFNAPLTPWVAVLKSCLYFSPILAGYLIILYHYARRWVSPMRPNAQHSLRCIIFICWILPWIAGIFTYNRVADTSPATTTSASIQHVGYHTSKYSRHYFVVIKDPNPALLPFIQPDTITLRIQTSDAQRITPSQTSISFPLYRGALGLPWTPDYTYTLIKPLDALSDRLINHSPLPKTSTHHNVSFTELSAACNWTKLTNTLLEIESIAPTSYIRDYWSNGAPRSVIPLVGNEKHGIEHDTFKNGQIYGNIPWKHNKKHGVFTLYRPDGSTEQRLSYKDGAPYGINQWFDSNGQMTYSYLYINEKVILPAQMCRGM